MHAFSSATSGDCRCQLEAVMRSATISGTGQSLAGCPAPIGRLVSPLPDSDQKCRVGHSHESSSSARGASIPDTKTRLRLHWRRKCSIWHECCCGSRKPLMVRRHREVTMEEVNARNSPQELAIRFLLRHAECQRMLIGTASQERQPAEANAQRSDTTNAIDKGKFADIGALSCTQKPTLEGSFSARFSQAYAAARQLSSSKRAADAGSRRMTGSNALHIGQSASAAA